MLAAAARLGGDFQPAQLKRMQVRCFAWGAAVAQAGWLAGCGGAEASCVQLGGGRGMDRSCAGPGLSSQIQHAVLRHITPLVAARPRGQADGAAGRAAAAVFGGRCGRVQGGWPGGRACSGVCGGGEGQTTGLSWVPACAQPALLFHLHAQPAAPLPPTPPPSFRAGVDGCGGGGAGHRLVRPGHAADDWPGVQNAGRHPARGFL